MCTLYDRITELCKEKGVSGSRMCLDLGLSKSTLSDIKSGRKKGISTATAQKMAAYLNVSVDYLLGEEEQKEKPVLTKKDELDIARDLEAMMQRLDEGGDLMFDGDPISDEARASILNALQMGLEIAKVKNKERFTPKKYRKD